MDQTEELREQIKSCDISKPYVFISYKRSDADRVYPIVLALQKANVNVWIDKELKSEVGTDWQGPAFEALKNQNCRVIIYFVSKKSLISPPVLAELLYSKETKPVFYHGDEELPILPYDLDRFVDQYGGVKGYVRDQTNELEKRSFKPGKLKNMFPSVFFEDAPAIYGGITDACALAIEILKAADLLTEKVTLAEDVASVLETIKSNYKDVIINSSVSTTSTVSTVSPVSQTSSLPVKQLWKYTGAQACAYLEWDGQSNNCIVKKGSRIAAESNKFADNAKGAKKLKDKLIGENIIVDDYFTCDYACDKVSTMINLLGGGSISKPLEIQKGKLAPVPESELPIFSDSDHVEQTPYPKENPSVEETKTPTEEITGPVPLGGSGKTISHTGKAKKLSLKELVQEQIVSAGDEVYVQKHPDETGIISENGEIQYKDKALSLNKFVLAVLGPGSRNAYDYVYLKQTDQSLNDLR